MAWFTWSKVAGLLALAGLAGAFSATYISQAARWTSGVTLFVSTPDGAAALQGLSELAKDALATPSLAAIIRSHDLYKEKRAGASLDRAVDQMRKDLRIRTEGQNAIRVEVSYPDPAKAQLAASSIASSFIERNLMLRGKVIEQGRHPNGMQIRLTGPASLPHIQEAPNRLASARLGLALGGLLGGTAVWFLGRRRAVSA